VSFGVPVYLKVTHEAHLLILSIIFYSTKECIGEQE
jgi:hypothetical protein